MWETELKILGKGGASVYDTNELKWGQVLSNAVHRLRAKSFEATGVKPSITKDSILCANDLVKWRELKSLNLKAGQWRSSIVEIPSIDKLIGNKEQEIESNMATSSRYKAKSARIPALDKSIDLFSSEGASSSGVKPILVPKYQS
jgi:ABC-type uncharacterized transport system auxiliary subunit